MEVPSPRAVVVGPSHQRSAGPRLDRRSRYLCGPGRAPSDVRVRAEAEKGYKDRGLWPHKSHRSFRASLQSDPEGLVFNPLMQRDHGKPRRSDTVSSVIVEIAQKNQA